MNLTEFPLVTIVTPTYNRAGFIEETIESVFAQSYPNIEYIIINDGSTDDTASILKKYAGIAKIINKENGGQVDCLTLGWSLAKGVYLSYLSDDDILKPDAVSKILRHFSKSPKAVCVYPDSDLIDPNGRLIKEKICRPTNYDSLVINQECHIGPGAIFTRDVYELVGPWSKELKIAPDREFWMRVGFKGEIEFLNDVLASYRMHESSLSYKLTVPKHIFEYIVVMDAYFKSEYIKESLISRKNEAYAKAYLVVARAYLRALEFSEAYRFLLTARNQSPRHVGLKEVLLLIKSAFGKYYRSLVWRFKRMVGKIWC